MEEVLVPLGLFASVVLVVYLTSSHRQRERLELASLGIDPATVPAPTSLMGSLALCWGLVLIALAAAAIIYYTIAGEMEDIHILFAIIAAFFCGVALIVYHLLTGSLRRWGMQLYEKKVDCLSRRNKNNSQARV